MHGCGESKSDGTGRSLLSSVVNKPALDTHELGGEVNTASTGLYNERRAISNMKEGIGKSSLVPSPIRTRTLPSLYTLSVR